MPFLYVPRLFLTCIHDSYRVKWNLNGLTLLDSLVPRWTTTDNVLNHEAAPTSQKV